METYYYAQLDENSVCVAVSQLSGPVDASYMIRLTEAEYSAGLVGWRYAAGEWLEPLPYDTLEELRAYKLQGINAACQAVIYAGIDVETSVGMKHFSLTEHDQIELTGLFSQVKDGTFTAAVPYHADGELCRFWGVGDFTLIAMSAQAHIFYHRTYCNHLREYIRRTDGMNELHAIEYGADLPLDLQESVAALIGGVLGA